MNSTLLIFNSVNRTAAAGLWNRSCPSPAVTCLPLLLQSGNCTQEQQRGSEMEKRAERKSDNIWTGTDYWKGKGCVREGQSREGRDGERGAQQETMGDKRRVGGWENRSRIGHPSSAATAFYTHLHLRIEALSPVKSVRMMRSGLTLDCAKTWAEGRRGARTQIRRVPPLFQAWGGLHCDFMDEICKKDGKKKNTVILLSRFFFYNAEQWSTTVFRPWAGFMSDNIFLDWPVPGVWFCLLAFEVKVYLHSLSNIFKLYLYYRLCVGAIWTWPIKSGR